MATLTVKTDAPPLRADPDGTLRVGKSRVLVDLVLQAHNIGESPEQIAEEYDTLSLADVYAVIAYYLKHRAELDEYLAEGEKLAAAGREEAKRRNADLRHKLKSRRKG